jgi:hypothetical protein
LSRTPGENSKALLGLRIWALIAFFYFAFQIVNPNSPSFLLSVAGVKNYMLYVPLAFVVPYLFTSRDDLEEKLRRYAVIMMPFAALGLVQFLFPPDHWLNAYLSYDDDNAALGSLFGTDEFIRARTIGTFSYIGGYVTFLTVMNYLGIALLANAKWRIKGNALPVCLIVVTLAAMFTTGSRTPFFGLILTAPVMLWIWATKKIMGPQQIVRMAGLVTLIFLIVLVLSSQAIDAYSSRSGTADDTWARIISPFYELYLAFQTSPAFGLGIGSAHSSASNIMQTLDYWWLNGNMFEIETARVMQETGLLGFILVYGCRVWLVTLAIGSAMRFRTLLYVGLSSVITGFFIQYLYLFVINNPTAGIYYWFCVGLIFAMRRLESNTARRPQSNSLVQKPSLVQSAY